MFVSSAVKVLAVSVGAAIVLTPIASELGLCCGKSSVVAYSHTQPMAMSAMAAPRRCLGDIVETASEAGAFSILLAAAEAAGLVDALQSTGPITLFAPNDEAFSELPEGTIESLLLPENVEQLRNVLKYHVVAGNLSSEKVMRSSGVATLNGQRLQFGVDGGSVRVAKARVLDADIECTNGLIHVIDRVLIPSNDDLVETADKTGSFTKLIAAAKAAGLVDALKGPGPFTLFAPTDEAFSKLPAGTVESLLQETNRDALVAILTYHLVPGRVFADQAVQAESAATLNGQSLIFGIRGGRVVVDSARVVQSDIDATNGVIHVIDAVLLPR